MARKITGVADAILVTKLALQDPDSGIVPFRNDPNAAPEDLTCTDIDWTIGAPWSVFHIGIRSGYAVLYGIRIKFKSGDPVKVESEAGLTDSNGDPLDFSRLLRGSREIVIPPDDETPWQVPGAGGFKGWPDPGPGGSGVVTVTLYGMEVAP